MAVHAQNPSTIFLFNRINDQDNKTMDCTIQDQAGCNTRKRGRDQYGNAQQQHVSTGLQLSFREEQGQYTHIATDLAAQIKLQSDEIDLLLHLQGEHLRRTLAETRARHYRALEESAARRLREKEAELERAARRGAELEERLARLGAESAAWQARARAEEAAAVELQARLRQAAAERAAVEEAGVSDAESFCAERGKDEHGPACRGCGSAAASVVALPCRHLCLCLACDSVAAACPVCSCVKSASVEIYFS